MPFALRSAAVFTLTSLLLVGLGAPACSQQGEGERCDRAKNADADCDDGLICVPKNELQTATSDRCCDPDETNFNDTRCGRGKGTTGSGGNAGSGSTPEGGGPSDSNGGEAGGEAVGASGSPSGGGPSETPAGGTGNADGGKPAMSDGGVPAAGGSSLPSAGQGGAD